MVKRGEDDWGLCCEKICLKCGLRQGCYGGGGGGGGRCEAPFLGMIW